MAEIDDLRSKVEVDRIKIANLEAALGIRKQTAAEKLASIENLPLADLKASKVLLIEEAGTLPPADLAARYIQARTDAKQRDERMSEMGADITQLQADLDTADADRIAAVELLTAAEKRIADLEAELADEKTKNSEKV